MNKTRLILFVAVVVSLPAMSKQLQLRDRVNDSNLVKSGQVLARIPAGTPFNKWAVNGNSYIVAYRREDAADPFDILADIYRDGPAASKLKRIISIPVFMRVDSVRLVSVEGDSKSQLAFFRSSGQQELLTTVALKWQRCSENIRLRRDEN